MAKKPEPKGPKPPLPGLLKITVSFTGPGTPTPRAANILHARWADNVNHSQANINTVTTASEAAVISTLLPAMVSTWRYQSTVVQSLGGDGLEASAATATNGAVGTAAFPPAVAVCGSWITTATWRGGRPRTYLPGVPTTATTTAGGSQISGSSISGYSLAFANFLTAMNAITGSGIALALGFPSYYTNYTIRPVPLFFPFLGVRVHGRLDSQRRRTGKESTFP